MHFAKSKESIRKEPLGRNSLSGVSSVHGVRPYKECSRNYCRATVRVVVFSKKYDRQILIRKAMHKFYKMLQQKNRFREVFNNDIETRRHQFRITRIKKNKFAVLIVFRVKLHGFDNQF